MVDVKSKVVIVTGGVKGLGLRLSRHLDQLGATVIVLDKEKDPTGIKNYIQCDVTHNEEVEKIVKEIKKRYCSIDILINNAAIVYSAPLLSLTPSGLTLHDLKKWNQLIDVNINGVFYVSRQVIKQMIEDRTEGLVINISSVCAKGNKGQSAYSASKAALNALTASWAKELMPLGIRVCGIAPGYLDFASTKENVPTYIKEEIIEKTAARRLGSVEEFLSALSFVVQNDFFVGKTLEIDGGLII